MEEFRHIWCPSGIYFQKMCRIQMAGVRKLQQAKSRHEKTKIKMKFKVPVVMRLIQPHLKILEDKQEVKEYCTTRICVFGA